MTHLRMLSEVSDVILNGSLPFFHTLALIFDGFRDDPNEPWVEDSGLLYAPVSIVLLNVTKFLTCAAGHHQFLNLYRWVYTSALNFSNKSPL